MPLKPSSSHSERKNKIQLHASSRNAKQQQWYRELVTLIIKLLNENDHDSLALIARNTGIPPQLRHAVWPVLLKYHPMVVSPNILSNTLLFKDEENDVELQYFPEDRTEKDISDLMDTDMNKYFQIRPSNPITPEIERVMALLKQCVFRFLQKWGKICKYESGLIWIALGLAEWCPFDADLVLSGKRHHQHSGILHLYSEYPIPQNLISTLPGCEFEFADIYERLVLVLFHSPELNKVPDKSNYHLFKGGNVNQQAQLFFKIFAKTLPELYQPITDEGALQGSKKATWLYWWLKCCGCRVLHRQDRGRVWDLLLGWRPRPDSINYYLDYNKKSFESIYSSELKLSVDQFNKICKYGNDQFWFPDLINLKLGQDGLRNDKDIFRELIRRNRYGEEAVDNENKDFEIPYSILDPHIELVFLYVAIMQHNEFKLLEFEETEISEFLNNVPLICKFDDYNFRKMYEDDAISGSSTDTEESNVSGTRPSTSNHMMIEVGTDDKTAHSFDDVYQQAGDIWRKWAWQEMEEFIEE